MKYEDKKQEQLLNELRELRQRVAGLEASEKALKLIEVELEYERSQLSSMFDGIGRSSICSQTGYV